ncbi:hypothetical protein ACIBL6_20320 [Streptomyces sp. NPDC050400]|uniref:hypothetical protein n=1 Tax=Streptomyces sp. NPDC050400 TaxID=3365610 RepID=UPI0037A8FD24
MTTQAAGDAPTGSTSIPSPRTNTHEQTGGEPLRENHRLHDRLRTDLRTLGVTEPVPLRVRVALHRRAHLSTWTHRLIWSVITMIGFSAGLIVLNALTWLGTAHDGSSVGDDQNPWLHRELVPFGFLKPPFVATAPFSVTVSTTLKLVLAITFAFAMLWAAIMFAVAHVLGADRPSLVRWFFLARRYALVLQCADAVNACANARRSGGEKQARALRKVSKRLRTVRRNIPDAPSARRTVPRFSARKRALRQHARHVAAALHAMELKIDSTPDAAYKELAQALVQISDRYCHARLGALVDEHQLEGVQRPPNRELLRWVLALFVAGGSVAGLAVSGVLPESAEGIIYTIAILLSLTIAFGRKIYRSIEVLGAITGGP